MTEILLSHMITSKLRNARKKFERYSIKLAKDVSSQKINIKLTFFFCCIKIGLMILYLLITTTIEYIPINIFHIFVKTQIFTYCKNEDITVKSSRSVTIRYL